MIYNNKHARAELLKATPWLFNSKSKLINFVNLCIYPQKWDVVYKNVREERMTDNAYQALKGALRGLLVLNHRHHFLVNASIDAYIIDFILLIRADRQGDSEKFMLNMRMYLTRFLLMVGLKVAFGINWADLAVDALGINKPAPRTYHSLLGNAYIRTLLHSYIVWKFYREPGDDDYEAGVNNVATMLEVAKAKKSSLMGDECQLLFEALQSSLPSENLGLRMKAAYAIDTAQDGWSTVNRQFVDWKHYQIGDSSYD
jgi:hypothetical protein